MPRAGEVFLGIKLTAKLAAMLDAAVKRKREEGNMATRSDVARSAMIRGLREPE